MKTKQSRPLAARSAFGRAGLKMATLLLSTGLLLAACGGGDDVLEAASEAVGKAISEEIEDRSDDAEPTDSAGGEGRPRPTEIEFGQTYGGSLVTAPSIADEKLQCRLVTSARSVVAAHFPLPSGLSGLGLSDRQQEVARAAAAGESSKEIAETFFLSARTVDNHLRSAYQRLGISGRHELASIFGSQSG